MTGGVTLVDLQRTALHRQLLASNHDQATSIRFSFGTFEPRNRELRIRQVSRRKSLETEGYGRLPTVLV
jgi:hypothetical protein